MWLLECYYCECSITAAGLCYFFLLCASSYFRTPSVLKCKTFRDVTFKIRHAQIFSEFPLLPPRAVSLHRPARSLSFLACFHGAPHFSARVAAPPWRRPSLPLAPHHHRPPHEYPLLRVTPVDTSSRSNVAFFMLRRSICMWCRYTCVRWPSICSNTERIGSSGFVSGAGVAGRRRPPRGGGRPLRGR
jgi:hypothetical protein